MDERARLLARIAELHSVLTRTSSADVRETVYHALRECEQRLAALDVSTRAVTAPPRP
jgi:hypothetical protein